MGDQRNLAPAHGRFNIAVYGGKKHLRRPFAGIKGKMRLRAMTDQTIHVLHHQRRDIAMVVERRDDRDVRADHAARHFEQTTFNIRLVFGCGCAMLAKVEAIDLSEARQPVGELLLEPGECFGGQRAACACPGTDNGQRHEIEYSLLWLPQKSRRGCQRCCPFPKISAPS